MVADYILLLIGLHGERPIKIECFLKLHDHLHEIPKYVLHMHLYVRTYFV